MEQTNFLMFCLGAFSLAIGLITQPYVMMVWNAFKSRIRRGKNIPNVYCDDLSKRLDEMEEQMNNLAKNHYTRESNRKNNIRREVRDYLKELRDGE